MNNLERFLERLGEEAEKSLSVSETATLVADARAHLEDDIQARLELGATLEGAEREAIRAFGSAEVLGTEIKRREPKAELAFSFGAVGMAVFFGTLLNVSLDAVFGSLSFLVFSGLSAAILWGSFLARRPQILTLVALFVATLGVSSIVASFTIRTTDETRVPYRKSQIPGQLAQMRGWTFGHERDLAHFTDDYDRFLRGGPTSIPNIAARPDDPKFNRWAKAALLDRIERVSEALTRDRRTESELEEAAARPWWRQSPYAPASVFQEIWPSFLGLGAVHLIVWGFGVAWRADRKRRRLPPRSAV